MSWPALGVVRSYQGSEINITRIHCEFRIFCYMADATGLLFGHVNVSAAVGYLW